MLLIGLMVSLSIIFSHRIKGMNKGREQTVVPCSRLVDPRSRPMVARLTTFQVNRQATSDANKGRVIKG